MLKGKKILLGVTGSIAAYKIAFLIRLLKKQNAEVKVIMTSFAKEFVTPLTLATLSENPVYNDFYCKEDGKWNSHVELGNWADLMLIAPATANTLAKMANGISDNLVVATYLAAKCPTFIAPAMDLDMFNHPSTKKNISALKSFGNIIINSRQGELASGLCGEGRMEEPEEIVRQLKGFFENGLIFKNKLVLVTAGPTYEKIDPVRFIGNFSSGKMGFRIAEAFANSGAKVKLISGPVKLKTEHPNIERMDVFSAEEMYNAVNSIFPNSDITIMAAAVADYTPAVKHNQKLKKKTDNISLDLKSTKDILAKIGKIKTNKQLLVGFALETEDELNNAKKKLKKKNLDFIVLNSLNEPKSGFEHDTNKITIIDKYNNIDKFALKTKNEVANDILNKVSKMLHKK